MKALNLKAELVADNFGDYPPILLEWEATQGRDDVPVGNLMKRLGKLSKPFNETWGHHLKVLDAMRDLRYLHNTVFNRRGLESLVEQYAMLDHRLKGLNKAVKQQKNFPEVGEYYQRFDYLLEMNVFDLMREDFLALQELAEARYESIVKQSPDHDWSRVEATLHEADLGGCYKEAVKKAKEAA